jgi:hypothetical protein
MPADCKSALPPMACGDGKPAFVSCIHDISTEKNAFFETVSAARILSEFHTQIHGKRFAPAIIGQIKVTQFANCKQLEMS